MVLPTTDDVVTETMSRGISHKAVALLDKRGDELSLQRVSLWQLSALKLSQGNNGCIQTQITIGRKSLKFLTDCWCCFDEWPC